MIEKKLDDKNNSHPIKGKRAQTKGFKMLYEFGPLVTRITQPDYYVCFSPPYPPGSIAIKNASDTWRVK